MGVIDSIIESRIERLDGMLARNEISDIEYHRKLRELLETDWEGGAREMLP